MDLIRVDTFKYPDRLTPLLWSGGIVEGCSEMTYAEQLAIVKCIPIKDGDTKVITCPFCYGLKKLAISKIDGKLMWNCYRASCNGKGIHTGKRNIQSVKNYLLNPTQSKSAYVKPYVRPLPSITTAIENHQPALDYLEKANSLEAYQNGYIKVRYDPGQDRVLFYSGEGAVGRLLKPSNRPKWISFGNTSKGFHVGKGSTAVLVEDVASACSVSRLSNLTGVALLGTNITNELYNATKHYIKCFLILDKDASTKAIKQRRQFGMCLNVRLTNNDLKELTKDQIERLLNQ